MTGASDLRDVVREHGGELYAGGRAAVIPGPGHSPRDRSLSLRIAEDGHIIFFSHAGDSARDCMTYLGIEARHSDSRSSAEERARFARLREAERRRQEAADAAICDEIWAGTVPIEATPAEAYLWSRGLILETEEVRFHLAAPRTKDRDKVVPPCPAMVALVRSHCGAPKALHLTYLTDAGGKAFGDRSRLMFGMTATHAVHLAQIGPARVLAVGEGLETCAAYSALKRAPCWSALSTAGLQAFFIPRGVRKLVVAADGDRPGMKAAQALAERASRVCDVEIDPAPDGQDWNDVLVAAHV